MELEHSYNETNGLKLHVAQTGPKSGIPVVLLHGFPEFWYGWTQLTKQAGTYQEICHFPIEKCAKCLN